MLDKAQFLPRTRARYSHNPHEGTRQHAVLSELYLRQQGRKKRRRTEMNFRESSSLGVFSGAPRFTELSAVPTAMPLTGEPQSARTPRQADLPQSQSRAVPSLEQERTFLPRSTMAVSKIPAAEQNPRSETAQGARTSPGTPQFSRHSTTSPKAPFPACQQQIRAGRLHADKSWGVKRGARSHSCRVFTSRTILSQAEP